MLPSGYPEKIKAYRLNNRIAFEEAFKELENTI
jgi:hypothetical protein